MIDQAMSYSECLMPVDCGTRHDAVTVANSKMYVCLPFAPINLLSLSEDPFKIATGVQRKDDIILPGVTIESWQLHEKGIAVSYYGNSGHLGTFLDAVVKLGINFYDIRLKVKDESLFCYPSLSVQIQRLTGMLISEITPRFHRQGHILLPHEVNDEDMEIARKQANDLKIYAQVSAHRGRL